MKSFVDSFNGLRFSQKTAERVAGFALAASVVTVVTPFVMLDAKMREFYAKPVEQQMLSVRSGEASAECYEPALGGKRHRYTRLIAPDLDKPAVPGSQTLRQLLRENEKPAVCRITLGG